MVVTVLDCLWVQVYEFLATQERPTAVNPGVHAQVPYASFTVPALQAETEHNPYPSLPLPYLQVMAAPESERGRVIGTSVDACQLCAQAMRIFTAAYGAEAGVAALKWLPTGGEYRWQ